MKIFTFGYDQDALVGDDAALLKYHGTRHHPVPDAYISVQEAKAKIDAAMREKGMFGIGQKYASRQEAEDAVLKELNGKAIGVMAGEQSPTIREDRNLSVFVGGIITAMGLGLAVTRFRKGL
jgi:hypothetical protein